LADFRKCKTAQKPVYMPMEHFLNYKTGYVFSSCVFNLKKNNLLLFYHNIQLAPASGHIIFPQSSIGPRKRANYFSPTINWLQQVGILSFPNKIGSIKWAYYFFLIIKWPQQRGTLFFTNYQLAPASRHIIFQKH